MTESLFAAFFVCTIIYCRAQILSEGESFPRSLSEDFPDDFYPPEAFLEPIYEQHLQTMTHRSGGDVVLQCKCQNERKIHWEFQPCKHDSKNNSCESVLSNLEKIGEKPWIMLDLQWRKRKCRLELRNVNETNTGLYRCVENNVTLKTFQLEIEDPVKYESSRPQLLSIFPTNSTIPQNAHLIIQCKVFSESPPSIWWFKETLDKKSGFMYLGKYYCRINTSDQLYPVPGEINVYLSKLNIYNARDTDSGEYVCAAVSTSGLDYRIATVKVISPTVYWEPHTSFSLLFLIPLAFALVPVTVWLCYYRKKKKNTRRQDELPQQERKLIRPILNNEEIGRVPVV